MLTALIVGVVLGLMLGFAAGRRWAERARALYDMRQVWAGRRRYRE
jgi:hypothetical protein